MSSRNAAGRPWSATGASGLVAQVEALGSPVQRKIVLIERVTRRGIVDVRILTIRTINKDDETCVDFTSISNPSDKVTACLSADVVPRELDSSELQRRIADLFTNQRLGVV